VLVLIPDLPILRGFFMPQRPRPGVAAATAVTALGAFALAAPAASAAVSDVPCDSTALVQAVAAANATAESDTLSLTPDCVYTLTTAVDTTWGLGLPMIKGTLTVNGNNATIARAPDAPQFRIFMNDGDLTLNAVTLTGGHALDGVGADSWSGDGRAGENGGAVLSWGPLTVTDSVITGNAAGAGSPGADGTDGRGGAGGFGGGIALFHSASSPVPVTITDSQITNNTTGAGARGGNAVGRGRGGSGSNGGSGGGIDAIAGIILQITGSVITGNATADGGAGGAGGPTRGGSGDGGTGGLGAGVAFSGNNFTRPPLNPVISGTRIADNRAGRGGDAGIPGPGGSLGYAGAGGAGGGVAILWDSLTVDGGVITGNTAGDPGTGDFPRAANGGGIDTVSSHVTLTNGAVLTDNKPNNCGSVAAVTGCVNTPAE
jgi:hypothetical protein